VSRVLTTYIYFVLKNKSLMIKKCRLWKSKYEDDKAEATLQDIEAKYGNYTHVKIDADVINKSKEQLTKKLHEIDLSDLDVLVVELPKEDEFVFIPEKAGEQDEDFEDPLNNRGLQDLEKSKFTIDDLNSLDLDRLFKKSSARGLCGLQNLGNTCFMNSGL